MQLTRTRATQPGRGPYHHFHVEFTAEDFPRAALISPRLAAMGYGLDGTEGAAGTFALEEYSGSSGSLLLAEAALASPQHMTTFFNTTEVDFTLNSGRGSLNEKKIMLVGLRFGFEEKIWRNFARSFSLLHAGSQSDQDVEWFYYAAYLFQVLSAEPNKYGSFFVSLLSQYQRMCGRTLYLSPRQALLVHRAAAFFDRAFLMAHEFGQLFAKLMSRFSTSELEVLIDGQCSEERLTYLLDIATMLVPGESLQAVLDAAESMPEEVLRALLYDAV